MPLINPPLNKTQPGFFKAEAIKWVYQMCVLDNLEDVEFLKYYILQQILGKINSTGQ
jgi:hypothetical protein